MAITLTIYILSNIFGLAFQQFAFMQLVRETPPYKLIERASQFALLFFTITWITGLYYYASFYDFFEKTKIMNGDYPWVHQTFVETKGISLVLLPVLSVFFIRFVNVARKDNSKRSKTVAIVTSLVVLVFAALNIGAEMLIGGAAN